MVIPVRTPNAMRGRTLLYALTFPGALALDIVTPLGIADWLLEVTLVWIASTFGTRKEMRVVFLVGSITILCGLWSSPENEVPLWMGALNRMVAVAVMGAMVNAAEARRAAEEAEREAAAHIKILHGLIPICCVCKSIKDSTGTWHKLEKYLSDNSEAHLTHGLCPPCAATYREEIERIQPVRHENVCPSAPRG